MYRRQRGTAGQTDASGRVPACWQPRRRARDVVHAHYARAARLLDPATWTSLATSWPLALPDHGRLLLVARDKSGKWKRWYAEAIPHAEQLYEIYLKERAEEETAR